MLRRSESTIDQFDRGSDAHPGVPGRSVATAKLAPRPQPQVILRTENPAAAAAFADRFGRRADNGVAEHADVAVDGAASSSGQPLPDEVRERFEQSLGADLSGVRVHTGDASAEAAAAVGARAYTVGQDIHFAAGQYAPADPFGIHLLAHETAHTVQAPPTGAGARFKVVDVSTPGDALESEADHAADAMVAGRPASINSSIGGVARKVFRYQDPSYGSVQGAGDEAEKKAQHAPLQVDTISVSTDRSRVGELIADIDQHTPIIQKAEKENSDMEAKYAPLATNSATKAKLSIFNDKLDVSAVDTTAFAAQYRTAYADYQRLTAEANEVLAHSGGAQGGDPLAAVGDGMAKNGDIKLATGQAGLERFRAARQNMNTAGIKMDGQLTACRGAANLLQGAVNKARAAAAAASGKDAAAKLAAVRAEIAEVAAGVGKVVKICSAVAGLAGGGGATNALGTAAAGKELGHVDIDPSRSGLARGGTVDLDPEAQSKMALIKAMGADASSVAGGGGGPAAMAESLVKAIGEYANKDKISKLQQSIIKAAAEEATFKAAGDAQTMVGYQDQMDAASKQLSTLLLAFTSAKAEMNSASQALMAELGKGGKKGQDQAKGVLFLTDADRFLAQVNTSISVGENQQQNLKQAATDRKALRGTTAALEGGKDQKVQYYYRCRKTTAPGTLWGTNDMYKLEKVDVTFEQSGGFGQNDINQGGAGSVEGTGSADDEVAHKLDVLKKAKTQVTALQSKVQAALGMGGAGINA